MTVRRQDCDYIDQQVNTAQGAISEIAARANTIAAREASQPAHQISVAALRLERDLKRLRAPLRALRRQAWENGP